MSDFIIQGLRKINTCNHYLSRYIVASGIKPPLLNGRIRRPGCPVNSLVNEMGKGRYKRGLWPGCHLKIPFDTRDSYLSPSLLVLTEMSMCILQQGTVNNFQRQQPSLIVTFLWYTLFIPDHSWQPIGIFKTLKVHWEVRTEGLFAVSHHRLH